jgi:MraZ protein
MQEFEWSRVEASGSFRGLIAVSGDRWGKLFLLYPQCSFDEWGYLRLEPKLACKVSPEPVLAPTLDGALGIYGPWEWGQVVKQLERLPDLRYEARILVELVSSNAVSVECDAEGRIRVPDFLRRLTHINSEVLLVSAADHVELWNPPTWHDTRVEPRARPRTNVVA